MVLNEVAEKADWMVDKTVVVMVSKQVELKVVS